MKATTDNVHHIVDTSDKIKKKKRKKINKLGIYLEHVINQTKSYKVRSSTIYM